MNLIYIYFIPLYYCNPELFKSKNVLTFRLIVFLVLFWGSYMAITVSVQYNGGVLPNFIPLTLCDYIGNSFNTMKSLYAYS